MSRLHRPVMLSLILSVGLPSLALAVEHEVRILLDLDNDTATGCQVNTVEGPFDGVEQILITTVETSSSPMEGTVTDLAVADCVDEATNTFGAPSSFDGGWPVGIGNGAGGRDVVETYIPSLSLVIEDPSIIHLGVVVNDEFGGQQALLTQDGTPDGPPILLDLQVNEPPNAVADEYETDEDTPLDVADPGVLTNDTDPEGDPLTVISFDATSAEGAAVSVNPGGGFSYDPTGAPDLQALGAGDMVGDTFTYTIEDPEGGSDTATVTVTVEGLDLQAIMNIPTLGKWGVIFLALLLAAAAIRLAGRGGASTLYLVLVLTGAGVAWGATVLDGLTDDWSAGDQLASNGLVVFGKGEGDQLCFRVDIDLLFNTSSTAQSDPK